MRQMDDLQKYYQAKETEVLMDRGDVQEAAVRVSREILGTRPGSGVARLVSRAVVEGMRMGRLDAMAEIGEIIERRDPAPESEVLATGDPVPAWMLQMRDRRP